MTTIEQLISSCKKGKRDGQSKLYQMFAPKLFGVSLRYSRDQTEAEDTLHEAFVNIFSKIDQYSGKGSFEGWMRRIVVNIALEKYRKRFRVQTVEDVSIYDTRTVNDDVYDHLNAEQLMQLIKELPPRYKMVFNLYAIDGYTHKEIAEIMGIDEGTSKSNLSRARKILQNRIFEIGYLEHEYSR
ncbi:MAG TPA: RNA polymerase sigma factor [Prolixibacteraceae bacterium]|nr:RNA polymerase sigma factor [Prolixibacteraceae bacterium]HPR62082.1 RNA polymerase sigma factor [Prolixibacteraceae bacterium]